MNNPIDLLPIKRPLEDNNLPNETYFYDNVIKYLIPDVLRMESNGIPISLDKVRELDNTVINVLSNVRDELSSNGLMLKFLKYKNNNKIKEKEKELESKKKTYTDFYKPFKISDTTHRTYLVNTYLESCGKEDMIMDKWSIKDLKQLNNLIASKFIDDLINKRDISYEQDLIDTAMISLAQDKANIFNKNKIDAKKESIKENKLIDSFNPASSNQIAEFFNFYGIESENTTPKGNPKWDRDELEKLSKLLNTMIEDKE